MRSSSADVFSPTCLPNPQQAVPASLRWETTSSPPQSSSSLATRFGPMTRFSLHRQLPYLAYSVDVGSVASMSNSMTLLWPRASSSCGERAHGELGGVRGVPVVGLLPEGVEQCCAAVHDVEQRGDLDDERNRFLAAPAALRHVARFSDAKSQICVRGFRGPRFGGRRLERPRPHVARRSCPRRIPSGSWSRARPTRRTAARRTAR